MTAILPAAIESGGPTRSGSIARLAAGPTIAVPFRRGPRPLSKTQKQVNAAHARNRGPDERAIANLKTWKLLIKLRCCPHRATAIVAAIRVLQTVEDQPKRR